MNPGIYTLTRRIENPSPDRRSKNRWLQAVAWEPGARFAIRRAEWFERELSPGVPDRKCYEMISLDERYSARVSIVVHKGVMRARNAGDEKQEPALLDLIAALTPSTDPDDALRWLFIESGDGTSLTGCIRVLFRLVRQGSVNLDQVRAAMNDEDREDALDEEAGGAS